MGGFKLTPGQAEQVKNQLFRLANYLIRLRKRMERVGFRGDDPIYRTAVQAQHAIQALTTHLHYTSCKSGVGKDPVDDAGNPVDPPAKPGT